MLKKVWSHVREVEKPAAGGVGHRAVMIIGSSSSLTPRKVPGRNTRVKKVMTCMEDESRAVCRAMWYMLSVTSSILRAESSILCEVSCPLSANTLLTSVLYDWRMELY